MTGNRLTLSVVAVHYSIGFESSHTLHIECRHEWHDFIIDIFFSFNLRPFVSFALTTDFSTCHVSVLFFSSTNAITMILNFLVKIRTWNDNNNNNRMENEKQQQQNLYARHKTINRNHRKTGA